VTLPLPLPQPLPQPGEPLPQPGESLPQPLQQFGEPQPRTLPQPVAVAAALAQLAMRAAKCTVAGGTAEAMALLGKTLVRLGMARQAARLSALCVVFFFFFFFFMFFFLAIYFGERLDFFLFSIFYYYYVFLNENGCYIPPSIFGAFRPFWALFLCKKIDF
jgi:hypothetical protein